MIKFGAKIIDVGGESQDQDQKRFLLILSGEE